MYEPSRSPIRSGPKTMPKALYPIRSDVGSGFPCSSSLGAFSAALPMRQSRPKTAQIRSRRSCDVTVPIAKAISLALILPCFGLVDSNSPSSWP